MDYGVEFILSCRQKVPYRTPVHNTNQCFGSKLRSWSSQQKNLSINIPWSNITREKMDHGVEFILSCWLKVPYRTPVDDADQGWGSGLILTGFSSNPKIILSKNILWSNIAREKMDHGVECVLSCWQKVPYHTLVHDADQGCGSELRLTGNWSSPKRNLSIHIPWYNITREKMDHGVEYVLSCWIKVPYRTPVHNTNQCCGSKLRSWSSQQKNLSINIPWSNITMEKIHHGVEFVLSC